MKHSFKINTMAFAVATAVAVAGSAAFAAKPSGVGGGGGKKPPVETANNLSYPALFFGTSKQTGIIGSYSLGASLPTGMSYGCAVPETIGTTTYPNTSCVVDGASVVTPLSYEDCAATKCSGEGVTIERIYWQKNAANKWQAGYATSSLALPVDYVDWGDNLESRSWPVQVIRVETNTFADLTPATTRFEMWHVFGQGTNELWGVHATEASPTQPLAFTAWPYAVNVSDGVRLNIAKLANGQATCPTVPPGTPPYTPTWNSTDRVWTGTWVLYDAPYTAELNIKGSYVYGYNWNLRSAIVPGDVNKAGWWRLTFYTSDNSILFDDAGVPKAPPTSTLTPAPLASSEEGDTGPLYVPVVDTINNLTYIDICITSTKGGGSKKPPK